MDILLSVKQPSTQSLFFFFPLNSPLGEKYLTLKLGTYLIVLFLHLLKPLFPEKGAKSPSPYNGLELVHCTAWRNLYRYLSRLTSFTMQVRSFHPTIPSLSLIMGHIF